MAIKRKKQRRIYHFEISRWGLLVIGIATFGILMWMFILGMWAEKHLIGDSEKESVSGVLPYVAQNRPAFRKHEILPPISTINNEIILEKEVKPEDRYGLDTKESGSLPETEDMAETQETRPQPKLFFTLQVASLRDPGKAEEIKAAWERKGYEVFITRTEIPQAGVWYQVQIGRFNTIDEAETAANRIVDKEKIKLYITTVSVPASAEAMQKGLGNDS